MQYIGYLRSWGVIRCSKSNTSPDTGYKSQSHRGAESLLRIMGEGGSKPQYNQRSPRMDWRTCSVLAQLGRKGILPYHGYGAIQKSERTWYDWIRQREIPGNNTTLHWWYSLGTCGYITKRLWKTDGRVCKYKQCISNNNSISNIISLWIRPIRL